MSLLMDALKKAEKARLEKTQDTAGADPDATRGLSLESLESEDADTRSPMSIDPDASATPEQTSERSGSSDELSYTPPPSEPADPSTVSLEDEDNPTDSLDMPSLSLVEGEEGPPGSDDPSQTLPSIKAAQESVDRYFDGTHSVSMSMEQVRSAMDDEATVEHPRAQTSEDSGRHKARAVFEAKGPAGAQRPRWPVYALLVLLLLGIAGGGGFYFWQLQTGPTLVARSQPPPRAEPPPAPAQEVSPSPASESAAVAAAAPEPTAETGSEPEPSAQRLEPEQVQEVPTRGDLTPEPEPEPVPEVESEPEAVAASADEPMLAASGELPEIPTEDLMTDQMLAIAGEPEDVVENLAAAISRAGLSADASGPDAGIKISKHARSEEVNPDLQRAYEAYRAGDDAAAATAYEQVLAEDPRSRDALLGLAAVAVRGRDWDRAGRLYLRVLAAYPKDDLAQAGWIALQENIDPVEGESHLKNLLNRNPRSGYLYFSLGNIYAAQSRWPEAQNAFFNAYRADTENADYVYNLAVSLDHLGQRRTALEYYRRALELADSRYAGFDSTTVLARIQSMAEGSLVQ